MRAGVSQGHRGSGPPTSKPRNRLAVAAFITSMSPIFILAGTFAVLALLGYPEGLAVYLWSYAVLAAVLAPFVALVLVFVSRRQTARTEGERAGDGFSKAAKVLGLLWVGVMLLGTFLLWAASQICTGGESCL